MFPAEQCYKLAQILLYDQLDEQVIIRYRVFGPFSHLRPVFRKALWKEDCSSDLVSAVSCKGVVPYKLLLTDKLKMSRISDPASL